MTTAAAVTPNGPDIGIHENVPEATYHAWDAASASRLRDLARSPAYCRYRMENPDPETSAKAFGTALHCAVLEPERFDAIYVPRPDGHPNSKQYKGAVQDLLDEGKRILKQAELDSLQWVRDNVQAHPLARDLIATAEYREVSCVATHPQTGTLCKVRPDLGVPAASMLVDVKSTRDGRPQSFKRDVQSYGYHQSGALYLDIANALQPDAYKHYVFLVVENTPPHEVDVYNLDPAAEMLAREEIRPLLLRYDECLRTGVWPVRSNSIAPIGVPKWAYFNDPED